MEEVNEHEELKSLIIGYSGGYGWPELRNWVRSAKKNSPKSDVIIVTSNMSSDTARKLTSEGVIVHAYGNQNPDGSVWDNSGLAPHIARFYYIWKTLTKLSGYNVVWMTDVRDVVFQGNPFKYLLLGDIWATSEGLTFENEPWGSQNMKQAFGPEIYNLVADKVISNVGVIGGYFEEITKYCLELFLTGLNRGAPVADQAAHNLIVNYLNPTKFTILDNNSFACINLGTTEEAIRAGKGDLGMLAKQDMSVWNKYQKSYLNEQPKITDDGQVLDHLGNPINILHQYDRIPKLAEQINKMYGDT